MQATIQYIKKELAELYPENEIQGIIKLIFESICGWNYTEQILNREERINEQQRTEFKTVIARLKQNEPIQYIIGETDFMGLNLKVNESVLIPRPETEELVQWIVEENLMNSPAILDIGTGSGCIPLALKSQIPDAQIMAIDISGSALEVAKENARRNNLEVNFLVVDILQWENYNWGKYDIIVSNPPYVRELEKAEMGKNVLIYEPEGALFVSNTNPLIFYKRIAEFANEKLHVGGKLFFEINEKLGREMYKMLENKGFEGIELRKDINGKNRMMLCEK